MDSMLQDFEKQQEVHEITGGVTDNGTIMPQDREESEGEKEYFGEKKTKSRLKKRKRN